MCFLFFPTLPSLWNKSNAVIGKRTVRQDEVSLLVNNNINTPICTNSMKQFSFAVLLLEWFSKWHCKFLCLMVLYSHQHCLLAFRFAWWRRHVDLYTGLQTSIRDNWVDTPGPSYCHRTATQRSIYVCYGKEALLLSLLGLGVFLPPLPQVPDWTPPRIKLQSLQAKENRVSGRGPGPHSSTPDTKLDEH